MTPEETSLARLLVALPGWRLPASHPALAWRVYGADGSERTAHRHRGWPTGADHMDWRVTSRVLDLYDPATAGCLLGMLEAAAPGRVGVEMRPGEPYKIAVFQRDQRAKWGGPMSYIEGPSLGVAAARALVAIGRAS